LRLSNYNEYYIDHGCIMIGYLDIDINDIVYINSSASTPVISVYFVTCVHDTLAMTVGWKREETPEGDIGTVLGVRPVH
jgi:hypothetical protein